MHSLRMVLLLSPPECSRGDSALPDVSRDTADQLVAPRGPNVLQMLPSTPAPLELSRAPRSMSLWEVNHGNLPNQGW